MPCSKVFAFSKQSAGVFKDEGTLGVEVKALDADRFVFAYHDGTTEYYSHGYLVGTKDTNGNTLSLHYTQGPQLAQIRSSQGSSLHFAYNAQGLVHRMFDQSGRSWHFSYGVDKALLEIRLEEQLQVSYSYHRQIVETGEVLLLSHVKAAGKKERLTFGYDAIIDVRC